MIKTVPYSHLDPFDNLPAINQNLRGVTTMGKAILKHKDVKTAVITCV